MKELAILEIWSCRSMGKTETGNAISFELHTFHIFGGIARPAAFDSVWLIMEFHVTLCFWFHAYEKFSTLHISNSILEFIVSYKLTWMRYVHVHVWIVVLTPFLDQCSHMGMADQEGRLACVLFVKV